MTNFTRLLASAALVALSGPAMAANFSYTGTFADDDDVELFSFTLSTATTVTLATYGYAGGTMADGTVIAAGGFDPILTLFDGAGVWLNDIEDGLSTEVATDPVTGETFDAFAELELEAGIYTVALTQFDNLAMGGGLDNGFFYDAPYDDPNFTAYFGCSNGQFCDLTGDNRTGGWALDILVADTAPVPLPAGLPLLLAGLGGFAVLRRRGA